MTYLCEVKIALLGYGKMGLEIEKICDQRNHTVVHRFNRQHLPTPESLQEADVVIEFTNPESARENILSCFDAGVPVVTGTTGWYQHFDEIKRICAEKNAALFTATNFSLGVNITFFINKILAKIMAGQNGYKANITEIHHTRKLDAPSGTAITLAEGIIENNQAFSGWKLDSTMAAEGLLPIHAIREGDVPGTHIVRYQSDIDSLSLTHEAHNRQGFALGAVLAAEFVAEKKGVFGMHDMLNFETLS